MFDFLGSANLAGTLLTFAAVLLGTISLALLWEGVRRGLRSRGASRALRKIAEREAVGPAPRPDGKGILLQERRGIEVPAWLEPVLLRLPHREDLQRLLDRSASRWSVATVLLASAGMAFGLSLVGAALFRGTAASILAMAIGAYLPFAYLKVKATRRLRSFEEHFSGAIDLLARAARAGHSLATGLQVVGEEAEEPVAGEFRQVYEEQRFGLPLKDSLLALADRIDLVDVRIFVTAVLIQRESGGNLAENLDNLSEVIRGRFRFKRDVKTKTAHGRMTGMVVGLAPIVAAVLMYSINPDYMEPLLVEPTGRMMLLVGGGMMGVGFLVIRRLVDVKF